MHKIGLRELRLDKKMCVLCEFLLNEMRLLVLKLEVAAQKSFNPSFCMLSETRRPATTGIFSTNSLVEDAFSEVENVF